MIFHKVFVTACLEQFDRGMKRPNIPVFVTLSAKFRETGYLAYHVDTWPVAIFIYQF